MIGWIILMIWCFNKSNMDFLLVFVEISTFLWITGGLIGDFPSFWPYTYTWWSLHWLQVILCVNETEFCPFYCTWINFRFKRLDPRETRMKMWSLFILITCNPTWSKHCERKLKHSFSICLRGVVAALLFTFTVFSRIFDQKHFVAHLRTK